MCRNIRTLYNYAPPATAQEVHLAALQYVRKVSGTRKPSAGEQCGLRPGGGRRGWGHPELAGRDGHRGSAKGPRPRG